MKHIFLPIIFLFFVSCSQTQKEKVILYEAGFKILHTIDRSRFYKPGSDTTDYLHYRPLDIDIWYPAGSSKTDSAILFRDIVGLLEKRTNYYTASAAGNGVTQQLAQYLCNGLKCSDTTKLLNSRTKSFKNALAVEKAFPLVIYLCAFNGMSFENFALFEKMAREGFVVVSVSSIGRFPGDMTMKKDDLMEQVSDAVFSINQLKQSSNIDPSKIGVIGYSWGGLAGAVLAGKISNVACLISLDGSEFHHYGGAKEENNDFNGIRNSEELTNMRLSMPYLRLESSPLADTTKEDSVYNFLGKLAGEKYIFKIDSAQHEDFSCLPVVVRKSGNCKNNTYFDTISTLAIGFLQEHLKNIHVFSEVVDHELNKTIRMK